MNSCSPASLPHTLLTSFSFPSFSPCCPHYFTPDTLSLFLLMVSLLSIFSSPVAAPSFLLSQHDSHPFISGFSVNLCSLLSLPMIYFYVSHLLFCAFFVTNPKVIHYLLPFNSPTCFYICMIWVICPIHIYFPET